MTKYPMERWAVKETDRGDTGVVDHWCQHGNVIYLHPVRRTARVAAARDPAYWRNYRGGKKLFLAVYHEWLDHKCCPNECCRKRDRTKLWEKRKARKELSDKVEE